MLAKDFAGSLFEISKGNKKKLWKQIIDILESKKYFFETRREASAFFGKSPSWATTLIKTGIGSKGRYYGYDVQ